MCKSLGRFPFESVLLSKVNNLSLRKVFLVEREQAVGLVLCLEVAYRDGAPCAVLAHLYA